MLNKLRTYAESKGSCSAKLNNYIEIISNLTIDHEYYIDIFFAYDKGTGELYDNIEYVTALLNKIYLTSSKRKLIDAEISLLREYIFVSLSKTEYIVFFLILNLPLSDNRTKETLFFIENIFIGLANYLGIHFLKDRFEQYFFQNVYPVECKKLQDSLNLMQESNRLSKTCEHVKKILRNNNIKPKIVFRTKSLYSTWKKMHRKNISLSEVYDIYAIRIIVKSLRDCYQALDLIHREFKAIDQEFDDYISNPKANGYQSLHTAIQICDDFYVECQIRTNTMHEYAETGLAAHWMYKENKFNEESSHVFKKKFELEVVKRKKSKIYAFTPGGEIKKLDKGYTVLDFAYHIHTELGHGCRGALVNSKIANLTTKVKNGDWVEIISQKTATPSRKWLDPNLGFIFSSRSKSKIVSFFRKLDRDQNIEIGKNQLKKFIKKLHIDFTQDMQQKLLSKLELFEIDELYYKLALNIIKLPNILDLLSKKNKLKKKSTDVASKQELKIIGLGTLKHSFAQCCNPSMQDPIKGFVTLGEGVSVHKYKCPQFLHISSKFPHRVIDLGWGETIDCFPVKIKIISYERPKMLADISTIIASNKANIINATFDSDKNSHLTTLLFEIEIIDFSKLGSIISSVENLSNIVSVERVT